jgi:hypothetical protein
MMTASGSGGSLLHTLKVFDDPTAASAHTKIKPRPTQNGSGSSTLDTHAVKLFPSDTDVQMELESEA